MKIGIFGGSFNPIHAGHIHLARYALSELNLDRIIFVPSFQNPLKEKNRIDDNASRIALIQKAIQLDKNFNISLCEIQRKGLSYTVDTLRYFNKKFKNKARLYFLTGADTLHSFEKWRSLDEIFKLCRFVVAARPGYALNATKRPVILMPFDAINISSTRIRQEEVCH